LWKTGEQWLLMKISAFNRISLGNAPLSEDSPVSVERKDAGV